MNPEIVIAAYKPIEGKRHVLLRIVADHISMLRELGFATMRPRLAFEAADGTILEVFEWVSAEAIDAAHKHPEVQQVWGRFGAASEYVALNSPSESGALFPGFKPLDLPM